MTFLDWKIAQYNSPQPNIIVMTYDGLSFKMAVMSYGKIGTENNGNFCWRDIVDYQPVKYPIERWAYLPSKLVYMYYVIDVLGEVAFVSSNHGDVVDYIINNQSTCSRVEVYQLQSSVTTDRFIKDTFKDENEV